MKIKTIKLTLIPTSLDGKPCVASQGQDHTVFADYELLQCQILSPTKAK